MAGCNWTVDTLRIIIGFEEIRVNSFLDDNRRILASINIKAE
jgi:hypothetical protein